MVFPNSNSFRRSLLAGAVAAALALSMGHATAQTGDSQATKQSTETKRAEKDARKSWEQAHRASKIIGSEVRNAQDQKVGKVKDLVLGNPSSGTISHVVVSVGGVAGMGDKLFAVPFDQIQQVSGKDYLVLSAASDLSKGFDEKSWPAGTAWQQGNEAIRNVAAPATTSPAAAAPIPSRDTSAASPPPSPSVDTSAASSTPGTSVDTRAASPAPASPPPN